jgi:signal transduction histidine kinase
MAGMRSRWPHLGPTLLAWAMLTLAGGFAIVRVDIAQRRDAFLTDARIAHRLLSQRAVQHEAILDTLALLSPAAGVGGHPELRLPAVYPQVLTVLRRDGDERWPEPALQAAEEHSRATRRAALAPLDAAGAPYAVVLAGAPTSFALRIDPQRLVPWDTWPLARDGPVRVVLQQGAQALIVLQAGAPEGSRPAGLTAGFSFAKTLDATSQPFELRLQRATGPAEWPGFRLFGWASFTAMALAALGAWQRGRRERRRAVELLRVGQVARLNALGELAGGMAHELNQPLTAVLANTQAARRLLDDDPPALAQAQGAMAQAVSQARRAADVVARLRRLVESPDAGQALQAVPLQAAVRGVTELLEPELRRCCIQVSMHGQATTVQADPVALEQILHNLIGNAMQALAAVPESGRCIALTVGSEGGQGVFSVRDSGPGIAADDLPRLFEPFFTTRANGLGLGLSLCESLAQRMHGTLSARNVPPSGAEFRLSLPLAPA